LAKIAMELQEITTLDKELGTLSQLEYDIQIDAGVLVVLTQDLIDISNDLIAIPVANFANGLYYLQIAVGHQKMINRKVIINRLY